MQNNKDLEELFKHIQIGIAKGSVKELNEAITSYIVNKEDKHQEINYVFKIVCSDYETTQATLKQKNVRGIMLDAKQIIYCILHFNLGFSIRYIAKNIFGNNKMSVYFGIKRLKEIDTNIKQDRLFLERYDKLSNKLIQFIKEKNNQNETECLQ
jgi:predicted DNA-binding protein YlxM (UPF0122 family)